jgi:hypothetical protein
MKVIGEGKEGKEIFSFTGASIFIPIIFIAGLIFISSCTDKYEFTMGHDFFDSQTRLQVIDTFGVDVSTILLDSLKTSATKVAYAGSYEDNIVGSVKCGAYFDLSYSDFSEIEEKAIFDSAGFTLMYKKGNSYGDTTSLMTLKLHMLTEKIEPYSTYLYNTSSFDYSPEVTGSVSFYPSPNSLADTAVYLPVNALGEELFNKIRNKDEDVSSSEQFSDYIKGFFLESVSPDNKAIIGFIADEANLKLMIYYHINNEEPELKNISITMGAQSHQFNNVRYDPANSPLRNIKSEGNEITSAQTDNHSYMQGLVGLLPKFQFPTVDEILAIRRWKILKADLIIEPVKDSYDVFSLPEKLYIYDTDKENRLNSVLLDDKGNPLTANLVFDDLYEEEATYTYDITKFINNEFSDSYFDYEHGLVIGLSQDEFTSSLDRLLVECKNPRVKLVLYFLTY